MVQYLGISLTCKYRRNDRHKTQNSSRRQSKRNGSAGKAEGQVIQRQYINLSKLEDLLNTKFEGEEYRVSLQQDKFTIFASGPLSRTDIIKCG